MVEEAGSPVLQDREDVTKMLRGYKTMTEKGGVMIVFNEKKRRR